MREDIGSGMRNDETLSFRVVPLDDLQCYKLMMMNSNVIKLTTIVCTVKCDLGQ